MIASAHAVWLENPSTHASVDWRIFTKDPATDAPPVLDTESDANNSAGETCGSNSIARVRL